MYGLKSAVECLRRQQRILKMRYEVDYAGMLQGFPGSFVDFYRYIFCDYNATLTSQLIQKGFSVLGTADYKFMEAVYRIMRDLFEFRPSLTLTQFFITGFAERKIDMATSVTMRVESLIQRTQVRRMKRRSNILCSYSKSVGTKPGGVCSASSSSVTHGNTSTSISKSQTSSASTGKTVPKLPPGVFLLRAHCPVPNVLVASETLSRSGDVSDFNKPVAMTTEEGKERSPSLETLGPQEVASIPDVASVVAKGTTENTPSFLPLVNLGQESHNEHFKIESTEMANYMPASSQPSSPIPDKSDGKSLPKSRSSGRTRQRSCTPTTASYKLLNSNPRPTSIGTLTVFTKASCDARSPKLDRLERSVAARVEEICPTDRSPNKHSRRVGGGSTDDYTLTRILDSILQLTGKVDNVLSRVNLLESRLTAVELDDMTSPRLPSKQPETSFDDLPRQPIIHYQPCNDAVTRDNGSSLPHYFHSKTNSAFDPKADISGYPLNSSLDESLNHHGKSTTFAPITALSVGCVSPHSPSSVTSPTYQSQVNRIAAMLSDTQLLLNDCPGNATTVLGENENGEKPINSRRPALVG